MAEKYEWDTDECDSGCYATVRVIEPNGAVTFYAEGCYSPTREDAIKDLWRRINAIPEPDCCEILEEENS